MSATNAKNSTLTVSDYARHRGVSRRAVYNAINSGRIEQLADGRIDPADADARWSLTSSARVDAAGPGDAAPGRFSGAAAGAPKSLQAALVEATIAEKRVNTRAKELRLAQAEGALVPRESAEAIVAYVGRQAQQRMLDIAGNVSSRVVAAARAAETIADAEREVRQILDAEHRRVLEAIANEPPPGL